MLAPIFGGGGFAERAVVKDADAVAGGVGSLAVQLAKLFGAGRVIATASTDARRDLALSRHRAAKR
ncbi:zinc-binding dehydrogenase [Paractinoplanes ferrugineus]|uniref:zinc-binding dehydrogenase n=1 Tax=Paractinoplanes ferrugineus TaxID=113564 RepID=UPI0019456371|nr:zinc-binding dehydrogenase [Actinoplanes ferrugineus]